MRIYFCDLCNESVPHGDLDGGRAVQLKGRVICAQCEEAMSVMHGPPESLEQAGASHGPSAATQKPRGSADLPAAVGIAPLTPLSLGSSELAGGTTPATPSTAPAYHASQSNQANHAVRRGSTGAAVAGALAAVALLLTVGSTAFLLDRMDTRDRELDGQVDSLHGHVRTAGNDMAANYEQRLAELGPRIDEIANEIKALARSVERGSSDNRVAVQDVRNELAGALAAVDALGELPERIETQDAEILKVARNQAGLHADLLRLSDQVKEAATVQPVVPTPLVTEQESRPSWWALVDDLSSQNSGTRWQAVQALGNTQDPATADHLTPMLKDPDIFVRMATARILGDLRAVVGIPTLIDALEDPEASVREAAVVSLRSITGRDFKFDPTAREGDRSKDVKSWRDWWKKASEDLLGKEVFE